MGATPRDNRWERHLRGAGLGFVLAVAATSFGAAQEPTVHRALATRAELETMAAQVQAGQETLAEVQVLRRRLEVGDFEPGDEVRLRVVGEDALSGVFDVRPDRSIELPNIPSIPLHGVLRSELRDHITTHLARYIRDPQVLQAEALVRLTIVGAVNAPGFYQIAAETQVGEAMMSAAGLTANVELAQTYVQRGEDVVVSKEIMAVALQRGLSLDRLNLQGGDQIVVGRKGGSWLSSIQNIAILLSIPLTIAAVTQLF